MTCDFLKNTVLTAVLLYFQRKNIKLIRGFVAIYIFLVCYKTCLGFLKIYEKILFHAEKLCFKLF